MKASVRTIMVGIVTGALVTIGAQSASADSSSNVYGFFPNRLGHATFTSDGEIFRVWDDESDSRSVSVAWQVNNGPTHFCDNSNGDNSVKTCDLAYAEGQRITWQVVVWSLGGPQQAQYSGSMQYDRT
ncbi:hypothetical protein [Cellulomonas sp. NS3]|uniref:hypothetical protein n=1 Tax=Cellulomonas sp. NS3 TaxID=2973977 RepID=UPI002161276E|nr:hypothetical protein [Cellulomonas sp. NS3]